MAKFQFRLEALRKVRIAHRDEMRSRLADAYRAAQILEEQQQTVANEIEAMQRFQRNLTSGSLSNLNGLLEGQRYQTVLKAQLSNLHEQSKQLEDEVEKRRQAAVEADRAVRALDKLEQRQRQQHQQYLNRFEVKALDEIASQRFQSDS